MEEYLEKLLKSLNQLEVKGKGNIDILLGCIMATEQMIAKLSEEKEEESDG